VPRPRYIAELHEARYESLVCAQVEHEEKSAKYRAALKMAARMAGYSEYELRSALAHDFYIWMRQEGLPKPSRK
jgi:hypothetical protein